MATKTIYDGRHLDRSIEYYTPAVYDEVITDNDYRPLPGETEMQITYQTIDTIPVAMREQLAKARTADEAERVFLRWEKNGGYVEPRSRSAVWMEA